MGWTFTNKERGQTVMDFFKSEFDFNKDGRSGKVLDCAIVQRRTAYIAYETINEGKRDVIGIVCLLDYRPHDYYNFGYKDMSEEMGPNESRCPKRIFDLLTPTSAEYAVSWRQRCQEYLNKKAKAMPVKKGDTVKFAEPIAFTSGVTLDTFTFERGSKFRNGYGLYRITNWKERAYEIVKPLTQPVSKLQTA